MCEKTIKERELKRSCVSVSMSLPRAYEDPHELGALGRQSPPIENPSSTTDSSIGARYTNPDGRASLPHPPWSWTETSNGKWIWWTCKNSVGGIRVTNIC